MTSSDGPARPDQRPRPDRHEPSDSSEQDIDADARALASTLRLRILRLCLDEALTNREIAARLDRNPATVLHHVRTLVDRGFLAAGPVRRGARGSREVPYRATGKSWRHPGGAGQARVIISTFLEEVEQADPASVLTTRLGVRLDDAGHAELLRRMDALFQEYAAAPPTPGGTPYSLLFVSHVDAGRLAGPGGGTGQPEA
ncbi:hypothetical protein AGMMS50218_01480 [Actinomycetota bacterium]|nr:hypothetical protein AGMMS50218_01480 [Actinomycetota bacterium]